MSHKAMAETYKAEFEKRNNGSRLLDNPALDWIKVCDEVPALNNRNAGNGYRVYGACRVFQGMSHEEAIEYIEKNVIWR